MMIFIIIWIIWCCSEILLNRLMLSGSNDKKGQDKGSLGFMWIMITLSIFSGIIFSSYVKILISDQLIVPYIGLAIIVVGMILRFISIWTLGSFFTVDVTIREDHKIKKDGVYRFLRHPSYSGSLLSFIGFGISLNNWLSLIVVTILITVGLINRIRIEEKVLTDQFGADYLDYKKNTYRLIPWIY
ncbi:MAG: isoprenylcysteine carboxylmethyltransferase family protein [Bacteroidales bacterium]|jgi:protein-S-isoprenylcysteine O-methyltransferase Ste14